MARKRNVHRDLHHECPGASKATIIRGLPSEVVLEPSEDPIPRQAAVNLDSVERVAIAVLVELTGRLADERMGEVFVALEIAVDCGR